MNGDDEYEAVGPISADMVVAHPWSEANRHDIHERNVQHLAAYVRAVRAHDARLGGQCGQEPLCVGAAVTTALATRLMLDPSYVRDLLLSAIRELTRVAGECDARAAQVTAVDIELMNKTNEVESLKLVLAELTAKVEACETLIAEVRAYRPPQ